MSVLDTTDALDVAGYAAAVRRSLGDLGPEQVEDLTDDLEADLTDAMADERHVAHGRGLLEQFGPPEEYAAELRAAAGLAPARPSHGSRLDVRHALGGPARGARRLGTSVLGALREQSWWTPAEAFLVALRPAWWLVRGWIGYQVVVYLGNGGRLRFLPTELLTWAVLAACILLSVQWGRGAWFQARSVSWLAVLGNATAVVLLLPMLVTVQDQAHQKESVYNSYVAGAFNGVQPSVVYKDRPVDGVVVDGIQVSNLFAYDAEGNPLTDVQIYDDRGRPVRTTYDNGSNQYWFPEGTEPWSFVSRTDADGRNRWNVYPLQGAPTSSFTYDDSGLQVLPAGTSATTPPWPFAKAPALDAPPTTSIGADGPDASPSPTPTP